MAGAAANPTLSDLAWLAVFAVRLLEKLIERRIETVRHGVDPGARARDCLACCALAVGLSKTRRTCALAATSVGSLKVERAADADATGWFWHGVCLERRGATQESALARLGGCRAEHRTGRCGGMLRDDFVSFGRC